MRCADCMHGQGRQCRCASSASRRQQAVFCGVALASLAVVIAMALWA